MSDELQKAHSSASNRSREFRKGRESAPYVGIFYVLDGELFWEGVPLDHASTTPYVKIYEKEHSEYWEEHLIRLKPHLSKYDPYHFPRGRVVFSIQEGLYKLHADECILDNLYMIKKILSEMKLPETKVRVSWNVDCECAKCRSKRIHMNNKERRADEQFRHADDGRKLFFPYGKWGRGYIVPSAAEYHRLRRGWRLWLSIGCPVILSGGFFLRRLTQKLTGSFWTSIVVLVVFGVSLWGSFLVWNYLHCRNLKETNEKL